MSKLDFAAILALLSSGHKEEEFTRWRAFLVILAILLRRGGPPKNHKPYDYVTLVGFNYKKLYAGWESDYLILYPKLRYDIATDGDWYM